MTAKLHYFHGRGNAQQPRWALAAAMIPFTNVCLSSKDDFDALCRSGKLAYQQVPMFEDGERCLADRVEVADLLAIDSYPVWLGS